MLSLWSWGVISTDMMECTHGNTDRTMETVKGEAVVTGKHLNLFRAQC
jgi:hypothetical protein